MTDFTLESGTVIADMISAVTEDGQFDATETQVLRWLNERHRSMVSTCRCYRKTIDLGPTIEGQSEYELPDGLVEILQVTVGGQVWGTARHQDAASSAAGFLWLSGPGGVAGRDDDEAGVQQLQLVPGVGAGGTAAGGELVVYAAMLPPDLVSGDDSRLKVPVEYAPAIVSGAIATGNLRVESRSDLAAPLEQIFQTAVAALKRDTEVRFAGSATPQIRLLNVNA